MAKNIELAIEEIEDNTRFEDEEPTEMWRDMLREILAELVETEREKWRDARNMD